MDSTNNEKGYTNEQWESLLCRTFGDPVPAPKAVEPQKEPVAQTPPHPCSPIASSSETGSPRAGNTEAGNTQKSCSCAHQTRTEKEAENMDTGMDPPGCFPGVCYHCCACFPPRG